MSRSVPRTVRVDVVVDDSEDLAFCCEGYMMCGIWKREGQGIVS